MDEKEYTYFILIKIGEETSHQDRITETIPSIKDCLDRIAGKSHQRVFVSESYTFLGFFARTRLSANGVKAHFLGTEFHGAPRPDKKAHTSSLRSGDWIFVFEVGEKISGQGFSRAWTWLQHHGLNHPQISR
jgi:hypothetical protein